MTKFKGFTTKEEAKKFVKEHGGLLCYCKNSVDKRGYKVSDYMNAVVFGGLDSDKYSYCVQWNEV